jgi:Ca-activated chloride channel family protein
MTGWMLFGAGGWTWARPWGFVLLAVPLAMALLRLGAVRRQRRRALAYADAALLPYATRAVPAVRLWRGVAADAVLWVLLACALAGPRQPEPDGAGGAGVHRVAVMVLLDAGNEAAESAAGLSPLERARLLLRALAPRLRGERLGLIAYGRGPAVGEGGGTLVQLLAPTRDPALFAHFAALARPALFAGDASPALHDVMALAQARLAAQAPHEPAALLLLAGADGRWAGAVASRGVGERLRAARLPLFVVALPELDPALAQTLQRLARDSGGGYAEAPAGRSAGAVWNTLYARGIGRLAAGPVPPGTQWRELFPLFLWPALLLAAWRSAGPLRRGAVDAGPAALLAGALAAVLALGTPRPAQAGDAGLEARAWAAWNAHDDARAQSLYAAVPGWRGAMGEGDAAYRRNRFQEAARAFRRALLLADTPAERYGALFNLGDAAMHLPGGSLEAAQAFDAALRIRPGDAPARRNARLAWRQVEVDHPSAARTGIAKRAPASHHPHFGEQTSQTPSQQRRRPPPQASAPLRLDAALGAHGRIGAPAAPAAASASGSWQPPRLDPEAADKRLQLLDDATAALWRQRAAVDTRAARALVAEGAR